MNFLLLEKEEVSCGCFQSSQDDVRRIFRSSSDYSQIKDNKKANPMMVKKISDPIKSQKKSLKKQKSVTIHCSQKNGHSRQLSKDQSNISEFNHHISNQIEAKTQTFCPIVTPQFNSNFEERHKSFYVVRPKINQQPQLSEHFLSNKQVNCFNFSLRPVKTLVENQYEKLVDQEFKKDLQQFQLIMKGKNEKEHQKEIQNYQQKNQITNNISNQNQERQLKESTEIDQNQFYTEQQINELEKQIQKLTTLNQRMNKKINPIKNIQTLPEVFQQKSQDNQFSTVSILKKPVLRRERKQSFRNSAISYKALQLQTKRFKDKMYAKQIQSEKDGTSSQSDNMSEVVGRGWDGLTEQRIEIQGLDQMLFNDKKNGKTQTMITQQSHIKNSQVKTFTEYTSSFISPKTHKPTSTLFGAPNPKYGIIGMSYQNLDDFTRLNNSFLVSKKI